jgi:glycolate oxidase iron-sulfur subunit
VSEPAAAPFTGPDAPSVTGIDTCVHCGFCLPACPTYALWGEEMDSPRGRVYLMKAAVEGRAPIDASFVRHFDRCLGCLACVTACPSGVPYGPLVERTRAQIETHYRRPLADRLFRAAVFALFPFRARMRLLLLPVALARPVIEAVGRSELGSLLPRRLRALLAAVPPVTLGGLFSRTPIRTEASRPARQTVGLLTGCVQQLIFPETNAASARVLAAEGCDVVAPLRQGCCGALSLHAGRLDEARAAARRVIETFERSPVDVVVANAAGCGSAMKEYGHLLSDDPAWADRAARFSARVRDITELLQQLGPPRAVRRPLPLRVVYQDACHLSHAQGVRHQPRKLIADIPGVSLVEAADDMCCGSAGIYNLLEPEAAQPLGERKIDALLATRPDVIVTANPGCRLQLAAAARRRGHAVAFRHPVELIDMSIRGEAAADRSEGLAPT